MQAIICSLHGAIYFILHLINKYSYTYIPLKIMQIFVQFRSASLKATQVPRKWIFVKPH